MNGFHGKKNWIHDNDVYNHALFIGGETSFCESDLLKYSQNYNENGFFPAVSPLK